jgi:hypothetical protein
VGRGNRQWRWWWLTESEESKKENDLEVGPTRGVLALPTGGIKEAPSPAWSGAPIRRLLAAREQGAAYPARVGCLVGPRPTRFIVYVFLFLFF